MVNIWATFCNPCLSEMPELGELAAEYAKEEGGVQIIGICTDITDLSGNTTQEAVDGAKQIVEMTGAAYPHLIPNDEFMAFLMQEVPGVPTTFFVDENGDAFPFHQLFLRDDLGKASEWNPGNKNGSGLRGSLPFL